MKAIGPKTLATLLLTASAIVAPAQLHAETAREAELAARLERLEAEMVALRADLSAARSEQARTAQAVQEASWNGKETADKVAVLEKKPQPEGMRVGDTTLRIGGYVKLVGSNTRFSDGEVTTNTLGRDFYLPQTIPTGGGHASRVQDFSAKQSRFWMNLTTDIAGHTLKGYVETDFQTSAGTQGSQRTTNGYNLALRRAYVQFDKWTFGQDWTTFQYVGALPESTDYVGATEGTVFVRQPMVRYSATLSPQVTLHMAVEEPEGATATSGSPTLIENGDDRMPDFAARLVWAGKPGELSLAGLVREVREENAGVSDQRLGWGVSAAGKIFLNPARTGDVRFMVTYGTNIGRYVGLNFGPDAVLDGGRLGDVDVLAALGAVRVPLAPGLRINLIGSYQSLNYANSLPAVGLASFNKRAWSGAANLFWSPVKPVDLGIEYRHAERKLVGGAQGALDRLEFAAKYSF